MSFTPGQKVGDYEILAPLGAGGMGQVYKVRNTLSDRVEAMKVLLPNLVGQQELAGRFLREIKLLAGLDHPNIASLRTAQHVDNQLVMIMELVEGTTLAQRLRAGPVPEIEAVGYTIQVLSALTYAHARGIIHRDIKPANMMLMPNGSIKLMDFGIASAADDTKLTQTGSTLGSAYYMSPEQVQAHPLDGRSDLYSLGVSLYEMVTGLHPFEGDTAFTIMKGHIEGTFAAPRQVNPTISSALNAVVLRAMARQPDDRYQTAQEFSTVLEHVKQTDETVSTATPAVAASDSTIRVRPAAALASSPEPTLVNPPKPAAVAVPVPLSVAPAPSAMVAPPAISAVPPPPPVPVTAANPTPPPPVVAAAASPATHVPSSKRALYMILGSALTLTVIVLTAMRLPVFHGAASDATPAAAPVPVPALAPATVAPASASATTSGPAAVSAASPATGASAAAPNATGAASSATPAVSLAEPAASAAPTPSISPAPRVALSSSAAPVVSSARTRGTRAAPATAGSAAAMASSPRTDAAARSAPAAQSVGGDAAALLDDQDVRFVQMTARAAAMKTSYDTLKREQAASGYSPDPSLTAAVATFGQFLGRADAALAAHDGAAAKRYLDLAEPQIVLVEKTFGR